MHENNIVSQICLNKHYSDNLLATLFLLEFAITTMSKSVYCIVGLYTHSWANQKSTGVCKFVKWGCCTTYVTCHTSLRYMLIYYSNICVDKTKIDDLGLFKNIRHEQADCKPMKKFVIVCLYDIIPPPHQYNRGSNQHTDFLTNETNNEQYTYKLFIHQDSIVAQPDEELEEIILL